MEDPVRLHNRTIEFLKIKISLDKKKGVITGLIQANGTQVYVEIMENQEKC